MTLSRRDALRWGLAGAGGFLFPWGVADAAMAALNGGDPGCDSHGHGEPPGPARPTLFSPQIPRFEQPFRRLSELPSTPVAADLDGYTLTMQRTSLQILPGLLSEVWTYIGSLPGPLRWCVSSTGFRTNGVTSSTPRSTCTAWPPCPSTTAMPRI